MEPIDLTDLIPMDERFHSLAITSTGTKRDIYVDGVKIKGVK